MEGSIKVAAKYAHFGYLRWGKLKEFAIHKYKYVSSGPIICYKNNFTQVRELG